MKKKESNSPSSGLFAFFLTVSLRSLEHRCAVGIYLPKIGITGPIPIFGN